MADYTEDDLNLFRELLASTSHITQGDRHYIAIDDVIKVIHDERQRERERCAKAIRYDCPMCDDGHFREDPTGGTECEYCGRPIAAIRNQGRE